MHNPTPATCAAFLQAGGKSTRMGENKAFLDFQGQTLLARALQTLSQVCGEVTIVGEPETFASHGRVIGDIFPDADRLPAFIRLWCTPPPN